MELKEIKKIIELMGQNDLTRFRMERDGFQVEIERNREHEHVVVQALTAAAPAQQQVQSAPVPQEARPEAVTDERASEKALQDSLVEIKSPIVGTFYRASSPEAGPFVTTGSEVSEDTVVCIIEAMKVMNEINAEVRGIIRKVLVENASPVQFGQPLFLVEPL